MLGPGGQDRVGIRGGGGEIAGEVGSLDAERPGENIVCWNLLFPFTFFAMCQTDLTNQETATLPCDHHCCIDCIAQDGGRNGLPPRTEVWGSLFGAP